MSHNRKPLFDRRGRGFVKSDPILYFAWDAFIMPMLVLVMLVTSPCWFPFYLILSFIHWLHQNKPNRKGG